MGTHDSASPFQIPIFRNVWFASLASNFGSLIQSVGAAWLMTSIARSADMVALVQTALALPILMWSLVAGALADGFDRRRIMLAAQVFMLVVSVVLAVFAWVGWMSPWLLLTFTFLIGCGAAFNAPAWQASVGDMVPRAQLAHAVALNSMGFNIARSLGPAIGGVIVAAAGAAMAFIINALSYIWLLIVLARWRSPPPPHLLPREPLGVAIGAGLRYVAMSPDIRNVLLRSFLFGIGASSLMALLPIVVKVRMAGGPLTFGAMLGAFGVGAVAGALASSRVRLRLSTESIVRSATIALAAAIGIVAMSELMVVSLFTLAVAGAAWVLALSTFNVAVQMSAPRWVVARALSLYQMFVFAGIALGSWLWGLVTHIEGVRFALLVAGVVLFLSALLGYWRALAETAALNLELLQRWKEPDTEVPVEARTGPVVITIQYVIAEEDIIEFLRAMHERRRIRRRDGANDWKLLRDLADPEIWVERYSTPTWLDYIRHNSRLTHEDAVIPEKLRALHRGPERPIVRRMIERQTGALPSGQPSATADLGEPLTDPTRSA
ncbi:MAG TPA: MFS transporter [Steroidobacteraceae bacterium]|nr:MFS transporter [Steroidobacteraceae bacterium]